MDVSEIKVSNRTNQKAEDLLMGAPNQVSKQQLKDLHIKVVSDE